MRHTIAALTTLSLFALPAHAATRSVPVQDFSKIRAEGPFTVKVRTGQSVSVKASGPKARLDKLIVENRGGTLLVTAEKGWNWRGLSWGRDDEILVEISVPMIEAAELTGSGELAIDRVRTGNFTALVTGSGNLSVARLDATRLKGTVTGSGDLSLTGKASQAELSLTGSGDLLASALTVDKLSASLLGSGDLKVGKTLTARARLMGSGDIVIAGRPRCTIGKMGSGEVRCGG
jgi:hypothetical protein